MNEHAGPACALSGLIVGIFAVLLHDRIPPPPLPKSPARDVAARPARSGGSVAEPRTITQPSTQAVVPPVPIAREVAKNTPIVVPVVVPQTLRPSTVEPAPQPSRAENRVEVSKPARPVTPRPPFSVVGPGESLADVASRVYGSREAAEALWKANRDQVERIDSPLPRGTFLRTP